MEKSVLYAWKSVLFCLFITLSPVSAQAGLLDFLGSLNPLGKQKECTDLMAGSGFQLTDEEESLLGSESEEQLYERLKSAIPVHQIPDGFNVRKSLEAAFVRAGQLGLNNEQILDVLGELSRDSRYRIGDFLIPEILKLVERDVIKSEEFYAFVAENVLWLITYRSFKKWWDTQIGNEELADRLLEKSKTATYLLEKGELIVLGSQLRGEAVEDSMLHFEMFEQYGRGFLFGPGPVEEVDPASGENSVEYKFGQASGGAPLWYHQTDDNQFRLFGRVHEVVDGISGLERALNSLSLNLKFQIEDMKQALRDSERQGEESDPEIPDVVLMAHTAHGAVPWEDYALNLPAQAQFGFLDLPQSVSLKINDKVFELARFSTDWIGTTADRSRYYGVEVNITFDELISQAKEFHALNLDIEGALAQAKIPETTEEFTRGVFDNAVSNPGMRLFSRQAHGAELYSLWDMQGLDEILTARRDFIQGILDKFIKAPFKDMTGEFQISRFPGRALWVNSSAKDPSAFAVVGSEEEIQNLLQFLSQHEQVALIRMFPGSEEDSEIPGIFKINGGESYFALRFQQLPEFGDGSILAEFLDAYGLENLKEPVADSLSLNPDNFNNTAETPMPIPELMNVDLELAELLGDGSENVDLRSWAENFETAVRQLSNQDLAKALDQWLLSRQGRYGFLPGDVGRASSVRSLDDLAGRSIISLPQSERDLEDPSKPAGQKAMDGIEEELSHWKLHSAPSTVTATQQLLNRQDLIKGWILQQEFHHRFFHGSWDVFGQEVRAGYDQSDEELYTEALGKLPEAFVAPDRASVSELDF